jgi:hypothetical protein
LGCVTLKNSWENFDVEGDVVLRGFWYDRLQAGSHTYALRDDKPPTYIYSQLIMASKFEMPPTEHSVKGSYATYELRVEVLECIIDVIEVARFID